LNRLAHTYSIVAFDPDAGQLGVAVQSRYFSVGPVVPWLEAGVGAVATQSFVEISYGPLGLDLMRGGKTAQQALQSLLASDPERERRQVAMVDARGNVAVHTGAQCIPHAGHIQGDHFSVQANLMARDTVWGAMAETFQGTKGDLAGRMMAALEAAQDEGGDIRGQMSAALIVVSSATDTPPWGGRLFDLRVEDHNAPIRELRRLLSIAQAYKKLQAAHEILDKRDADIGLAMRNFASGIATFPSDFQSAEETFWFARHLTEIGAIEAALPLFAEAFAREPVWRKLVPELARVGRLPQAEAVLQQILAQ